MRVHKTNRRRGSIIPFTQIAITTLIALVSNRFISSQDTTTTATPTQPTIGSIAVSQEVARPLTQTEQHRLFDQVDRKRAQAGNHLSLFQNEGGGGRQGKRRGQTRRSGEVKRSQPQWQASHPHIAVVERRHLNTQCKPIPRLRPALPWP